MIDPKQYDWRQFSLTFYYNAHITRVFRTWTTVEGLESFFIERCLFWTERGEPREIAQRPEVGDRYSWQFRQDFEVQGEIKTYIDREQFSFSFGDMHVDVYFRVLGEQTEVQLVQSNIPTTPEGQVFGHLNCRSCWTFFMTNLSSVLDHNHDLRDQNPELVSSMEVGYIPYSQR
ncbi:MAG: SRPBCC domain-containing protein [Pseudomonadales bacterium]